jgi:hypothetical protein
VLESLVVEATTHEPPECLSLGVFFVAVQYKSAFALSFFVTRGFRATVLREGGVLPWVSPGLEAPLALILEKVECRPQ